MEGDTSRKNEVGQRANGVSNSASLSKDYLYREDSPVELTCGIPRVQPLPSASCRVFFFECGRMEKDQSRDGERFAFKTHCVWAITETEHEISVGGPSMESLKKAFVELTDLALPEEDVGKFVGYLDEREAYRPSVMDSLLKFSREEIESLLLRETQVMKRLQEKRARLLKEMEAVSLVRKNAVAI